MSDKKTYPITETDLRLQYKMETGVDPEFLTVEFDAEDIDVSIYESPYLIWLEEKLLKSNIGIVNELIDIEVNKQEELDCG